MKETLITYVVPCSLGSLVDFYADIEQYVDVHPLMLYVKKQEGQFKVTEKPFPWLPFTFKYFVEVQSSQNEINYRVKSLPLSELLLKFTMNEISPQVTRVNCLIVVKSKFRGKGYLINKMRHAQDDIMNALPVYLEETKIKQVL